MSGARRTTVVVAEAADPVQAEIWVDALRDAGIDAATFERGVGAALGGAVTSGVSRFPVVVATTDVVAARNIITELDGADYLAPFRDASDQRERRARAFLAVAAIVALIILLAGASRIAAG
ncbi:MAG: DUF2007 domain-containing protein [Dehalococcoidia bacterium]|nr:DUF2007 domain-containing protein [Dehalococcoidia bacterium]